jgi:hypothetical protein
MIYTILIIIYCKYNQLIINVFKNNFDIKAVCMINNNNELTKKSFRKILINQERQILNFENKKIKKMVGHR